MATACPAGAYCPLGAPAPVLCPLGTFGELSGGDSEASCVACPTGCACPQRGGTAELYGFSGAGDSIACAANAFACGSGFRCERGVKALLPVPDPETDGPDAGGKYCAAGHYCVQEELGEQPCAAGTYQPAEGQASCLPCPAGRLCAEEGMLQPTECPAGSYCPES